MLRQGLCINLIRVLVLSLVIAQCSKNPLDDSSRENVSIQLQISVNGDETRVYKPGIIAKTVIISNVSVTVTGPDMSKITKNLSSNNQGQFSGSIDIPKGNNRTFVVEATDDVNIVQYEGSTTKDIQADNESVNISLNPIYPDPVDLALVNINSTSVTLSWTRSLEADFYFYRLVRSTSNTFDLNNDPFADIDDINALSFTDDGLAPNTPYFYRVYVVDTEFLAMGSNIISVQTSSGQDAPTGLTVSNDSPDDIFISWNSVPGATTYKIYRDTLDTGSFPLLTTVNTNSFIDYDVDQARYYFYRVSAVSGSGTESAASDHVAGYRKGWRFSNIVPFGNDDGFGTIFDLRAYGYNGITREIGIYAFYEDGMGSYFFVPGSGAFDYAGLIQSRTPNFNEAVWFDDNLTLPYAAWDAVYQNNTFSQFVALEIYTSSSISSFNDESYDYFIFPITWNSKKIENPQFEILPMLDENESRRIKKLIRENPSVTRRESPNTRAINAKSESIQREELIR